MNNYRKIPIECFMTEPPKEWYLDMSRKEDARSAMAIAYDLTARGWRVVPISILMSDFDGHKRFGTYRRFPWMLSTLSCPELIASVHVEWHEDAEVR